MAEVEDNDNISSFIYEESYDNDINTDSKRSVVEIPDNIPDWKRAIYEIRNAKIMKEEAEIARANFHGEPEWRKIILRKKAERRAILEEEQKAREEMERAFTSAPKWQQDLILKKFEKYQMQQSSSDAEEKNFDL